MYVVVRQPKSVGIALLLTFLFWPLGLFYASVSGGFIMTFGPLVLLIYLFIAQNGLALLTFLSGILIYALLGWLVCIIWAVSAVNSYNSKLVLGAVSNIGSSANNQVVPAVTNEIENENHQRHIANRGVIVLVIVCFIAVLSYFIYDKKKIVENTAEWQIQSDASVYASPNIKSKIITVMEAGDSVEVLEQTLYFMKIKLLMGDGSITYGFVRKNLIKHNDQSKETDKDKIIDLNINSKENSDFSENIKLSDVLQVYKNSNVNFLSEDESKQEEVTDIDENSWRVISFKAYFYKKPNIKSISTAYLVKGDTFRSKIGSESFIHVEFNNNKGKITSGFIQRKNLMIFNNDLVTQDSLSNDTEHDK